MTGHLLATGLDPDHLVTLSRDVTTGLLRQRLGFAGAIVTDALEMRAVAGTVGIVEGFVQSLIAGADTIESGSVEHAYLVEEIPRAVERALREVGCRSPGWPTRQRVRRASRVPSIPARRSIGSSSKGPRGGASRSAGPCLISYALGAGVPDPGRDGLG